MTKFEKTSSFTRRSVLLGGGALVVSVGAALSLETVLSIGNAYAQGAKPPLTPDQLSSYIAVNANGSVAAYFGKMDMGHGLHVAIGQIVAEELDVPFKSVKVIMADTAVTVNQGGASGSTGIQLGGKQMRMAAAEARRVLVEMAAGLLSVPADKLTVNDGVVSAGDDKSKRISYAEMLGGKYFNVQLDWNKKMGNAIVISSISVGSPHLAGSFWAFFRVDKWGKRKRVSGCTITRTNCGSIDSSNEIRLISGAACLTL